jgi:hypothetical protein
MVAGDGSLQNVFVYVKDGSATSSSRCRPRRSSSIRRAASTARTSSACRRPADRDPQQRLTLHNIHAWPQTNQEFNLGQALQGMKDTHVFTTQEVMVPFRATCTSG